MKWSLWVKLVIQNSSRKGHLSSSLISSIYLSFNFVLWVGETSDFTKPGDIHATTGS